MVHAAMARLQPGEVLVLTMPEPRAGRADRRSARHPGPGARAPWRFSTTPPCATARSSTRWVCRSGPGGFASRGATKDSRRRARRAGDGRRPGDPRPATSSCSTPTARPSSRRSVPRRCSRRRWRARRRSGSSGPSSRRASSPTSSTACAAVVEGAELVSDLAHLGPVEMFTPKGEESLRFFVETMGMEVEHQAGPSTYLRGWGDYQRWSLKLTESDTLGHGRPGPARVEPGGAGAAGGGGAGDRPRHRLDRRAITAAGPATASPIPTATCSSSTTSASATTRRAHLRAGAEERARPLHRPRLRGQAAGPLNMLAADVRANRDFCVDALGYRLYERIELDDGSEAGAWMSATIAAHELIYTRDALGPAAACTTSPSGSTRARSACARPTSGSTPAIEIEAAPSKHAIAQGFFLYGHRAGRQPRSRSPRAGASSTRPMSRAWSGPRPTAPRARRGASRPCRAFTPTGHPRSRLTARR